MSKLLEQWGGWFALAMLFLVLGITDRVNRGGRHE